MSLPVVRRFVKKVEETAIGMVPCAATPFFVVRCTKFRFLMREMMSGPMIRLIPEPSPPVVAEFSGPRHRLQSHSLSQLNLSSPVRSYVPPVTT